MKRTVSEYMKLPYSIELTPDDGSYFAMTDSSFSTGSLTGSVG